MKRMILGLMLVCMVFGFAIPLFAADPGDVIVGDDVVLRIRFAAGGYTIQERVDGVTYRINLCLGAKPFDPASVRVTQQNGEWVVMIGNRMIITADEETARFNHSTTKELATTWANNLKRVIPQAKNQSTG